MFDQLNKSPQTPGANKPVEDIFADSDVSANKIKPAVFQPKASSPRGPLSSAEGAKLLGMDKRYFLIGLVALSFFLVVGGGFWGISKYNPFKGGKPSGTAEDVASPEGSGVGNIAAPENSESSGNGSETNVSATAQLADSDQDGLADEEEKQLGMDASNTDTDSDGLFDREEVKVYGTDPLKADTDGDGYKDGDEVKSGYNPKGTGKLYEINSVRN